MIDDRRDRNDVTLHCGLGTHLGLLGRDAGGVARPRNRLRKSCRDADDVGVLRVFPLGQGEGGVPVVDAAVDVLAPGSG